MALQGKFDAKAFENEIRSYLDKINLKTLLKNELLDNNNNNDIVSYIEGPPTLNGEPHAGHLRGRVIKDVWYRFNTLQKKKVIFRAGWDTQGLPVELQAEKELGLTGSKTDNLKKVGIEKIVETCKKLISYYNEKWVSADKLLGMSFDYENAYWTFSDKYIEREWQYLKKAWENGILQEWFRVVAYCPSCQSSLSNAEVNQGYEIVEDPSFYYKVSLTSEDAYLIVWTTMPFTVVTDEMIGVNPEAKYVYVIIKNDKNGKEEKWIVSEARLQDLMKQLRIYQFKIEKTIYGKDLDGKHYIHPLLDLIPELDILAKEGSIHFVVAEDFVDAVATGSGIVHLSPANGEVDFDIATKRNVPIFVPIDDRAFFTEKAGEFRDIFVRDADRTIIKAMEDAGAAIKSGTIKHQYPTCWRSHHKLVWIARREYFYIIKKLGDLPLEAAQNVEYFYEPPKNRFSEIIKEKVPWCISRERVWGTPLPIWSCPQCGHKDPLFSRDEIIKKASNLPDGPNFELHRPWIDRIVIKCDNCGRENMQREPFVLDTWHNSGGAPYASLSDVEYQNLIPASFLTEGIDQTRGWAYTLLMENVILQQRAIAPFKSFLFQGHVLDDKGNKMSKSIGNVIDAYNLLRENSVDLVRFYFMWKSSPIESLNFSLKEMEKRPYQVMSTLYYLHTYFKQNSSFDRYEQNKHNLTWVLDNNLLTLPEIWLLSKLQRLISQVTIAFEGCRYNEGAKAIEEFIINQLSQTYIPVTRNDIWDDSPEGVNRRFAIYSILSYSLMQIDIMLHPYSPFITDYLYLRCFPYLKKSTILLERWPKYEGQLVNRMIEEAFDKSKEVISLANAARMKVQLKRRWPMKEAIICSPDLTFLSVDGISNIIKNQLNVENYTLVEIHDDTELVKLLSLLENKLPIVPKIELIRKNIAPSVKGNIDKVIIAFEKLDKIEFLKALKSSSRGTFRLVYEGGGEFLLSADDLKLSYTVSDGYVMSERDNLMVFISTQRDKELTAKGFLRDLARNLQQLRKECGYNPTDTLSTAFVADLCDEEISFLSPLKDELMYLVRVKSIVLTKDAVEKINYKLIDLEGRKLKISIQ
ncbi:MAG TPA: class I tRNA ligase family protein [Nitrososphaeraceae archaeon]|nr:class I tRNA ligase family protein [Nitrososphaeraceae archaeon]